MTFPPVDSGSGRPDFAQDDPCVDEKSSSDRLTISTTASLSTSPPRALRMPSGRQVLFFFALVVFFGLACVVAYPPNRPVNAGFEDLLAKVSDASLHDVLHEYLSGKYKHGVYPEDRTAMQAVHHDDATLATNLVELAQRQISNSSSSSTPKQPTPLSSGPPMGSSPSRSVVSSSPPVVSSVSTTTPTISSTPMSSGSSTSTSYTISSTSQALPTSSSTPPSDTTPTTPSESTLSTSQVIYTTTLQDGRTSTITSVTVVGGGGGNGNTNAVSVSPTGTPTLQNVAAKEGRGLGLVDAIVLAAAMSFITL